ncbi:MAG: ABC transporter permease, partial [Moraxellaceae bacterium]
MNVPLHIAKRYFLSKKKRHIINIISNISMGGVAVGTMALIVVLSVFNGLEDLIRSIYSSFDPDLKIEVAEGKSFEVNDAWLDKINKTEGVAFITQVIEDNALLQYRDRQRVVRVKGVSPNFFRQNKIDSTIVDGSPALIRHGTDRAVLGRGIQYDLGISVDHNFMPLQLLYPKVSKGFTMNPENA